jgi:Immunity protein 74
VKITGTSSYILIEVDNKVVKVEGELLVNGFAAYTDTLKNWEPPHEKEMIDSDMKQKIIQEALDYTKDSHFKIEFV